MYPTGDGYLHPTVKALLANNGSLGGGGSGGGESTPVDLSGYVTTAALTTALATKADTTTVNTALQNYATLSDLTNVASDMIFQRADVGFTINQLDKIYIIHSTATDSNSRTVTLNFTYDQLGNGTILIYNASQTAPLRPASADMEQPFIMAGQSDTFAPGAPFNIPPGRWMGITRTDDATSGSTVSGGNNPAANYRCVLLT